MFEAVLVGGMTALTAGMAIVFWQLMVRPEVILALLPAFWDRNDTTVHLDWFEEQSPALWVARWLLGILVFCMAFATGLFMTFLVLTG